MPFTLDHGAPGPGPGDLEDVDDLDVEVSLLYELEPLDVHTEEEAIAALRPGVDGVVLTSRGRRATFLPVMWETFGDARTMLRELKRKAGLPVQGWGDDVRVARYTVDKTVDKAQSRTRTS